MKFLHCRAKVIVRFRTDGENRTVPEMAHRQRKTVRAGGVLFKNGEKAVH